MSGCNDRPTMGPEIDTQDRPVPGTQERPHRGELLDLDVESLAYGGRGIARRNGYVVFVAGGLPGDRVRAEVTKAKRGYAEASTREIVRPSPDRLPPRCDHAGEPCPGAPWQCLPYEQQLHHKQSQVRDSLVRLGGLEDFELEEIVPGRRAVALPEQARVLVRRARP